jgi:hypothetical protein
MISYYPSALMQVTCNSVFSGISGTHIVNACLLTIPTDRHFFTEKVVQSPNNNQFGR